MTQAAQSSSALRRVASQTSIATSGAIALEALFALMARLGDLKTEVIATIALALAAGIVYFLALYLLEHSAKTGAALWIILAGAVLFRLTLYSLTPSLSTDRKSTRLNSSHVEISYAVFCLKKKKEKERKQVCVLVKKMLRSPRPRSSRTMKERRGLSIDGTILYAQSQTADLDNTTVE